MNMDVLPADLQNAMARAKEDLKELEKKFTSKAETLEDIRDRRGKAFKTADVVKLMEKYDPEAFAQLKKQATFFDDGTWYHGGLGYISNWMDKVAKGLENGTISSDGTRSTNTVAAGEPKLSSKAQAFLKNLRKQYGAYDFMVGDSTGDWKALAKSGTKEFSVIFSNAELERMADDEEYAKEKLQAVEQAVKMSEKINEKYGFGKEGLSDVGINKIGIAFNEDGTTAFFAELEKSSARQRELMDKAREEKRAEKKEAERKTKKEVLNYSKNSETTKHTTVQAGSMEELFEKIAKTDWAAVKAEKKPESGNRYDFSV